VSIEYRVLTGAAEHAEACTVFWRSMVGLPPLGDIDPVPGLEPGRFWGAFDDGRVVACTDSYASWLTVPGGARVRQAAVTHVGTLPTHTRRGIMATLLREQLDSFARSGEVVALLHPSMGTIYERFGYGVATSAASARLVRDHARMRPGVAAGGELQLLDRPDARDTLGRIYEPAAWVGSINRPTGWWLLHHLAEQAEPIKPYRAVHGPPGAEDGFVQYRPIRPAEWLTSFDRTVVVDDFVAHTPAAYAGLLRHLLDLDIVDTLHFASLPADSPLPAMLTDIRAVRDFHVRDEAWLRLVDVAAALAARAYRPGREVVLEVTDAELPANDGHYLISGAGAGRTDHPATLATDVAALASAYLGGTHWWQLVRAGRAEERLPGAAAAADDLFATTSLPYCGTAF
jgi:predicted acetyltransferase